MFTILFLAAEPDNVVQLRLGEEVREIQEKLQLAKTRENFVLHQRFAVRPEDVVQAMLDLEPHIVHFSGHGTGQNEICLEDRSGHVRTVSPDALEGLFAHFSGRVSCVVLNACYSDVQAQVIARHIDYVIGMTNEVEDWAAIAFSIGFYQALGAGRSIEEAYGLGCVQIQLQGVSQHATPVLIKRASIESEVQRSLVGKDSGGIGRQVGSLLISPHRRQLLINQDNATKAELKENIERSDALAQIARGKDSLYDFLEWFYKPRGYPLLERMNPITGDRMRYPVTVIYPSAGQDSDPATILGKLNPVKVEERQGQKSPFIATDDWAWYQKIALRPDNYHDDGVKYVMQSINRNPLKISGALGWYFDVLRTCDSLEREILDYFGQNDPLPADYEMVVEQLSLRNKLHLSVDDPIVSGRGRSAALAMSVLVVYQHDGHYYCLLERRSAKTAVHSSLYHVVPSFMFGPESGSWQSEWNIWHQFQREFLEEVLGYAEAGVPATDSELPYDWFYDTPELRKLAELIREGDARFFITGIAVNLLNLRPEICAVLLIDSQEWIMGTRISYNWEFAHLSDASSKKSERVLFVPVNDDHGIFKKVDFVPSSVVPPGGAALWLGVDKVRSLLGGEERQTLPC